VVFWHDGAGESWFDDFEVQRLRAADNPDKEPGDKSAIELLEKEFYY